MNAGEAGWRAFFLLLGPFAGTYVATLAVAWPRRPRPVLGGSVCARCGAAAPAWRQAPLLSWALGGGKGACCGRTIPRSYPLGEAWGLATGAAAALQPGPAAAALAFLAGMAFAYVGLVDLRRFRIPLAGVAALALVALADAARVGSPSAALARGCAALALGLAFEALRRLPSALAGGGLGEGDALLAAALGALCDWRLAPLAVALAALAPLAVQAVTGRRGPVPFGLWLSAVGTAAAAWSIGRAP